MDISVELEIRNRLLGEEDPALITDDLFKRWLNGSLSIQDVRTTVSFAILLGFQSSLFSQFSLLIRKNRQLEWSLVLDLLSKEENVPDAEFYSEVLAGVEHEPHFETIAFAPFPSKKEVQVDAIFKRAKQFHREKWETEKKHDLKRIMEWKEVGKRREASKRLNHLLLQYPNDDLLKRLQKELPEFEYQSLPTPRKELDPIQVLNQQIEKEDREVILAARKGIIKSMLKIAKRSKKQAYDIAVNLHIMKDFDSALICLEKLKPKLSVLSLKLEILLEANRNLDALTLCDEIDEKYADQPEIHFSTMYSRALALWGLNEKTAAIGLMAEITKQQPDFRSAHSIVLRWRADS